MVITKLLFPPHGRDFTGLRWINISLRSLHLVGMAGMAGQYLYLSTIHALFDFWALTLFSGVAMVALSIWSDGRWLLQMRGAVILLKLVILVLLPVLEQAFSDGAAWGIVAIILLSSVIAHAPGRVRYHYWLHLEDVRPL